MLSAVSYQLSGLATSYQLPENNTHDSRLTTHDFSFQLPASRRYLNVQELYSQLTAHCSLLTSEFSLDPQASN